MTKRNLIDGITKAYNDLGFNVDNIHIEEEHGVVTVDVKAKASIFAINIPLNISVDYGALEPRVFAQSMQVQSGCHHEYVDKVLFTSSYKACKHCGEEPK